MSGALTWCNSDSLSRLCGAGTVRSRYKRDIGWVDTDMIRETRLAEVSKVTKMFVSNRAVTTVTILPSHQHESWPESNSTWPQSNSTWPQSNSTWPQSNSTWQQSNSEWLLIRLLQALMLLVVISSLPNLLTAWYSALYCPTNHQCRCHQTCVFEKCDLWDFCWFVFGALQFHWLLARGSTFPDRLKRGSHQLSIG